MIGGLCAWRATLVRILMRNVLVSETIVLLATSGYTFGKRPLRRAGLVGGLFVEQPGVVGQRSLIPGQMWRQRRQGQRHCLALTPGVH